MEIKLNGQTREVAAGTTVAALLEALGAPDEGTAVELNGQLLDRKDRERALAPGDGIEVVRFVGGG